MKRIYRQIGNNDFILEDNLDMKYSFVYKYKGKNLWHQNEEFKIYPEDNELLEETLTNFKLTTN